jgi:XTP/dITP diphosphohydrolase
MTVITRLVFASGNAGKVRELRSLLGDGIELITQTELGIESIEETGTTFAENALLKARHAAQQSGLPALADDSGLEVDYLNGAPGIYSARYAGPEADDQQNLDKLLVDLDGVAAPERGARFRCVLAFVRTADDDQPLIVDATWEGHIATDSAGKGGFGYDPVFIVAGLDCTSAQLEPAEKNARSHRGQAFVRLREELLRLRLLDPTG